MYRTTMSRISRLAKAASRRLAWTPPRIAAAVRRALLRREFPDTDAREGFDAANYLEQVAANYDGITNPFFYYRELVDALAASQRLRLMPMRELAQSAGQHPDAVAVALRHDIDADPWTALRCAHYLASRGICGSFYLLHTASYYGQFVGRHFLRNPKVKDWIRGFIVAGCEIGMHNDALGVCCRHGFSGVDALWRELDWLRANGAQVTGTVAHNSGPVYGAENFEIFTEHVLWDREVMTPGGKRLGLGAISQTALSLVYEGVFAKRKPDLVESTAKRFFTDRGAASIRSKEWMRRYLLENPAMDYCLDCQLWLIGPNQWVAAGRDDGTPVFEWLVGVKSVLSLLRSMRLGSRVALVIHPEMVRGGSNETDWHGKDLA